MKNLFLGLTILTVIATSCSKQEKRTERVFDVNINLENDFLNIENTKKQYNSHAGEFYSGVDSITKYGAGYCKKIDDTLRGYNLDIIINAWVREASSPAEGGIALGLSRADGSSADWTQVSVKPIDFREKEWIKITDTISYNSDFMSSVNEIKVFGFKPSGGDFLDVDDLRIKYIFYK